MGNKIPLEKPSKKRKKDKACTLANGDSKCPTKAKTKHKENGSNDNLSPKQNDTLLNQKSCDVESILIKKRSPLSLVKCGSSSGNCDKSKIHDVKLEDETEQCKSPEKSCVTPIILPNTPKKSPSGKLSLFKLI